MQVQTCDHLSVSQKIETVNPIRKLLYPYTKDIVMHICLYIYQMQDAIVVLHYHNSYHFTHIKLSNLNYTNLALPDLTHIFFLIYLKPKLI